MNLLAYTKKLSEKIAYYDKMAKRNAYSTNPFEKPVNVTIVWVDKSD